MKNFMGMVLFVSLILNGCGGGSSGTDKPEKGEVLKKSDMHDVMQIEDTGILNEKNYFLYNTSRRGNYNKRLLPRCNVGSSKIQVVGSNPVHTWVLGICFPSASPVSHYLSRLSSVYLSHAVMRLNKTFSTFLSH